MKKTGIILEIKNGKATIMKSGGEFISLPALPQWQKGDTVSFREKTPAFGRRSLAAAACVLFFLSLSSVGYGLWNTPVSLVSLDINPSIELQINRFDRVISCRAYNREAQVIVEDSAVSGHSLDRALTSLFSGGLESYLRSSPYITYSVQAKNRSEEKDLISVLKQSTDALLSRYPETERATVDIYPVSEETVSSAHSHHLTAGKYMTILQLQEVLPEAQVEEYAHCSISEIHQEIEKCSGHNSQGSGASGSSHQGHGHDSRSETENGGTQEREQKHAHGGDHD